MNFQHDNYSFLLHKFIIISLLVLPYCFGTSCSGGVYYISNQGLDTNDGCTSTTPIKTFSALQSKTLTSGSVVKLDSTSSWIEQLSFSFSSGTAAKPLIIESYGAAYRRPEISLLENSTDCCVYILGPHVILRDVNISKGATGIGSPGNYITIENITISHQTETAMWLSGVHVIVRNCDISDVAIGIELDPGSEYATITNNSIHDTRPWSSTWGGTAITLYSSSNNNITYNNISNVRQYFSGYSDGAGFWLKGSSYNNSFHHNIVSFAAEFVLINDNDVVADVRNNIFSYNLVLQSQQIYFKVSGTNFSHISFQHNTFYFEEDPIFWTYFIFIFSANNINGSNVNFYNNVIYGSNLYTDFLDPESPNTIDYDYNLFCLPGSEHLTPNTNDIVVDNLNQIGWVDTTTFKLQQSSPAVDSASPNSLFSFDYYGNPVPCDGVPDMGAVENCSNAYSSSSFVHLLNSSSSSIAGSHSESISSNRGSTSSRASDSNAHSIASSSSNAHSIASSSDSEHINGGGGGGNSMGYFAYFYKLKLPAALAVLAVIPLGIVGAACFVLYRRRKSDSQYPSSNTNRQSIAADGVGLEPLTVPGSDRVFHPEGSTFPVTSKINPQILTFGFSSSTMPIDREFTEDLTLGNIKKRKVQWQLIYQQSQKFTFRIEPNSGILNGNSEIQLKAFLTVHCTTLIAECMTLAISYGDKPKRKHTMLKMTGDTAISTKLDPDEIKVVHAIGDGSFGTVYKGVWRGQEIAIKKLKNQNPSTVEQNEFMNEVKTMEALKNPFIVNFIGASLLPQKLAIITELCSLGNITSAMQKHKFSPALKLSCLLHCAKGMNFIHQSSMLHRDLKPDNLLMISLDARAPVCCKISDLGCTRTFNRLSATQYYTKGVGTPAFMAPEILEANKYSPSADVYSFALVGYQIFTEIPPFLEGEFSSAWKIAEFVISGKRLPIPNSVPSKIKALIEKCWAQDPHSRPDFSEIVNLLNSNIPEPPRKPTALKNRT